MALRLISLAPGRGQSLLETATLSSNFCLQIPRVEQGELRLLLAMDGAYAWVSWTNRSRGTIVNALNRSLGGVKWSNFLSFSRTYCVGGIAANFQI